MNQLSYYKEQMQLRSMLYMYIDTLYLKKNILKKLIGFVQFMN